MSSASPALLAAAAGVGFGHAILPDHWVPLAVIGRTRRYSLARVARLSLLAGVAHVLVSLLLGGVIVAVGLQLRSQVQSAQDTIVGILLLLTGVGFAVLELSGRGHGHSHAHGHRHGHDHSHEHDHSDDHVRERAHSHGGRSHTHEHAHHHLHSPAESDAMVATRAGRVRGLAAIMVPFGAAASPDLTILPVFLAATAAGTLTAIGSLVVFSAVTIGTILALTLAAAFGGYQVRGQWLERWGNAITALVLIVIGALVLAGAI